MNKLLFSLSIAAAMGFAQAELDIPRGVYTVEKIAEAQALAVEKTQPMTFILSDKALTPS